MSLWKMGVGVLVQNNQLRFGKRVYALINMAGGWSSGTTITYDGSTGTDDGHSNGLMKYLNIGDKILVGPSSASGYSGGTEIFTITSVAATTIGVSAAPNVHFSNNDPITAIGSRMPDAWSASAAVGLTIGRLFGSPLDASGPDRGPASRYRAQFKAEDNDIGLSYKFNLDLFQASTKHRAGFYYQFYRGVYDYLIFRTSVRNYSGSWSNWTGAPNLVASGDVTYWTAFDSSVLTSPSSVGTDWDLFFYITGLSVEGEAVPFICDVYLEHASETDDEDDGVYTFDDYPSFGSRAYKLLSGVSRYRLRNNVLISNDPTGGADKTKKHLITASFRDASRTLRDNLAILLEWQDRGYPLVLHHDITGIPNNLYGYLNVDDTSLTHWSSGYCSFNLAFEER